MRHQRPVLRSSAAVRLVALVVGIGTLSCGSPRGAAPAVAPDASEFAMLDAIDNVVALASAFELAEQGRTDSIATRLRLVRHPSPATRSLVDALERGSAAGAPDLRQRLADTLADALRAADALRRQGAALDLSSSPNLRAGLDQAADWARRVLPPSDADIARRLAEHARATP